MITIKQIKLDDDLQSICQQLQPSNWAADNEMHSYQIDSLRSFLQSKSSVLLLAYNGDNIAGVLLGYILPHPAGEDSLYVHELDTHPDYRRQGVASQLMQVVFELAAQQKLTEVWVGTEVNNMPANALYKKLKPGETESAIMYSYQVK